MLFKKEQVRVCVISLGITVRNSYMYEHGSYREQPVVYGVAVSSLLIHI